MSLGQVAAPDFRHRAPGSGLWSSFRAASSNSGAAPNSPLTAAEDTEGRYRASTGCQVLSPTLPEGHGYTPYAGAHPSASHLFAAGRSLRCGLRSLLGTGPCTIRKDAVSTQDPLPSFTCSTWGGRDGQRLMLRLLGAVSRRQALELGTPCSTSSRYFSLRWRPGHRGGTHL